MANLVDIVKDIISLINLNIPVTSTDGVRIDLCYTLHITLGKIVTDENGLEYKVTDIENNSWIDVEPYGHLDAFAGTTVIAPTITFLHGSPSSVNSEYLKLDSRTLNKTPFIWLLESYEYDDLGKGSSLEASFNARMFFMDWCDASEWVNDEHNDLSIKPMTNLANAFLNVVDKSYSFKTVESSSVKVRSRFGVEVTNKGSERKIIDDDFSGVEVNVKLDLYDTEICCSSSDVPNYVCYPVTYDITDSDRNTLYAGTIASGGLLNQEINNSTAVLKNTLGTTLSTTEILAEGSEYITAPSAVVGVLNTLGAVVDGDSFASGTAGNLLAPDANYTVQYLNGTPIESGSIPSNTSKVVEVPDPITCADATVTLNDIEMTDIPSGDTENISVRQSTGAVEVGSKQGVHWRIADSVVTDSDGTDHDVKAEDSFICTPVSQLIPPVWADMFEGRVLFDGGVFEDKATFITNATTDFNEYNDASLAITPNGYKDGTLHAFKPFDGGGDMDWSRGSEATRVNESGVNETVGLNVPRIDHSNGEAVILAEPQATNLITYSEDFSNFNWVKVRVAASISTETSPSGLLNAYKLIPDTVNNTHFTYVNITNPSSETISIYAKKGGYDYLIIANSGFNVNNTWFDLDTGTIGTSVGFNNASIEDMGNGWFRCSVTLNTSPTTSFDFVVAVGDSDGSFSFSGDGVKHINIWGAQLEEGTEVTSYIPTNGSAVTRLADVPTNTPPIGTTKITEYFEDDTTNEITTIPATYTMSEGRLTKILFE